MVRRWITANELEMYIKQGYSLRKISKMVGCSVPTLSKICDLYGIEKPSMGRPKGYTVSEKTKQKISKKIKEWWKSR